MGLEAAVIARKVRQGKHGDWIRTQDKQQLGLLGQKATICCGLERWKQLHSNWPTALES
jgi:hypothetical protein